MDENFLKKAFTLKQHPWILVAASGQCILLSVIAYTRRRNICLFEIECKNCDETPTVIITSHTDWIWLNSSLDQPRTLRTPLVTQSDICIWSGHLKHSNCHLISTCKRLKSYYFDIKFLKKRLWEMKICVWNMIAAAILQKVQGDMVSQCIW